MTEKTTVNPTNTNQIISEPTGEAGVRETQPNKNEEKIKISSKVIAIIMKIGYITMIVQSSICAACLLFIVATGGATSYVTSGGTKIMVADAHTPVNQIVAICITAVVTGLFLLAIFYLAYRVFKGISVAGTPFNPKYVKIIKAIGILVAVMTAVGSVVDSIAAYYSQYGQFGFGGEMQNAVVDSSSTGYIVGVIIFCLAFIFEYGCMLQKQVDETL